MTGVRESLPEGLELRIRQLREQTEKPIAIGFGISTPEQVKMVSGFADGVIVGSAIVQIIEENLENPELVNRVGDYVASLSNALRIS